MVNFSLQTTGAVKQQNFKIIFPFYVQKITWGQGLRGCWNGKRGEVVKNEARSSLQISNVIDKPIVTWPQQTFTVSTPSPFTLAPLSNSPYSTPPTPPNKEHFGSPRPVFLHLPARADFARQTDRARASVLPALFTVQWRLLSPHYEIIRVE